MTPITIIFFTVGRFEARNIPLRTVFFLIASEALAWHMERSEDDGATWPAALADQVPALEPGAVSSASRKAASEATTARVRCGLKSSSRGEWMRGMK